MSMQDPATHARARQATAFRYAAERQALVKNLERKLIPDTRLDLRQKELAEQRRLALVRTAPVLLPLSRFVEYEIQRLVDDAVIEEGLVERDDVVMSTVVSLSDLPISQSDEQGLYPRLREVARKTIRETVDQVSERVQVERSLESPVRIAGEVWPDRSTVLADVLADPRAILPEDVLEQRELRRLIDHGLDQLPERWREVFLLRAVDAWDDDEIAEAEGIDVSEVELIQIASLAYLREYFRENRAIEDLDRMERDASTDST